MLPILFSLAVLGANQSAHAEDFTILFSGGSDPYHAAEYSQLSQFTDWKKWADARDGKSVTIFNDGTSSKKLVEEQKSTEQDPLNEKPLPFAPNVRVRENDKMYLKKYGVKDNFGTANLETLDKAFQKIPANADHVFLYVGDHGASPVSPGIENMGLADHMAPQDGVIVGWKGAKSNTDKKPFELAKDGRVHWLITTQDLSAMRDKYAPNKNLKFVMTQCFSGGFAGLALQKDGKHLRGDTCGAMAAPFYYPSSGCDPNTSVDYGFGYWAAKALKDKPDLDKNGQFSLQDLHYFALANDDYDRTPQLTSEVFLQQQGFLKWPSQEDKNPRGEIPQFEIKTEAGTCNSANCKSTNAWNAAADEIAESSDPLLNGLKAAKTTKNGKNVDEAIERYRAYHAAEKAYLNQASETDRGQYQKVKACESEAL